MLLVSNNYARTGSSYKSAHLSHFKQSIDLEGSYNSQIIVQFQTLICIVIIGAFTSLNRILKYLTT